MAAITKNMNDEQKKGALSVVEQHVLNGSLADEKVKTLFVQILTLDVYKIVEGVGSVEEVELLHLQASALRRCLNVRDPLLLDILLFSKDVTFHKHWTTTSVCLNIVPALINALVQDAKYQLQTEKDLYQSTLAAKQYSFLGFLVTYNQYNDKFRDWPRELQRDALQTMVLCHFVTEANTNLNYPFDYLLFELMSMREYAAPPFFTHARAMLSERRLWFPTGVMLALGHNNVHPSWYQPFEDKYDLNGWSEVDAFKLICSGFELANVRLGGPALSPMYTRLIVQVMESFFHANYDDDEFYEDLCSIPIEFWNCFGQAHQLSADPPRLIAENKTAVAKFNALARTHYWTLCVPYHWRPNDPPAAIWSQIEDYLERSQAPLKNEDQNVFGPLSWCVANRFIHASVHAGMVRGKWPGKNNPELLIKHWKRVGPHLRAILSTMHQRQKAVLLDLRLESSIDNCLGYCDVISALKTLPTEEHNRNRNRASSPPSPCTCDKIYNAGRREARLALPGLSIPVCKETTRPPKSVVKTFSRFEYPDQYDAAVQYHAVLQSVYQRVQQTLVEHLGADLRDFVLSCII